jgi:Leucine-rich repeat (LRR) protein
MFTIKKIKYLDNGLRKFVNLEELVLACNQLSDFEAENMPDNLKILDLTGNYLHDLSSMNQKSVKSIEHLGLSLNWLRDFNFDSKYWLKLVSLDLSANQLNDLQTTIENLSKLKKLKVLSLHSNPFSVGYNVALLFPYF